MIGVRLLRCWAASSPVSTVEQLRALLEFPDRSPKKPLKNLAEGKFRAAMLRSYSLLV